MNELNISQLNPAGTEFFSDSENYLNELTTEELDRVVGGDGVIGLTLKVGSAVWNFVNNPGVRGAIFATPLAYEAGKKIDL
jgi:hypothetical protein